MSTDDDGCLDSVIDNFAWLVKLICTLGQRDDLAYDVIDRVDFLLSHLSSDWVSEWVKE